MSRGRREMGVMREVVWSRDSHNNSSVNMSRMVQCRADKISLNGHSLKSGHRSFLV